MQKKKKNVERMATNRWLVYSELANIGKTSLKWSFQYFQHSAEECCVKQFEAPEHGVRRKLESSALQEANEKLTEAPDIKTSA